MIFILHIEEKQDISNKTSKTSKTNSVSETNNDPIEKYKSLLKAIEEEEEIKKHKDVGLEFTWGLGTEDKTKKIVEESMENKEELTPFQQFLEKRKAKKKAKREEKKKLKNENEGSDSEDLPSNIDMNDKYFTEEFKNGKLSAHKKRKKDKVDNIDSLNEQEEKHKAELELLLMDQEEDGRKHFNMKQIEENATMSKSKRKRLNKKKNAQEETKEDDFEVNVKDPRFAALFTSHHFNIDPADPHYRKTKGTEVLVNEKLKRRADNENIEDVSKTILQIDGNDFVI